MLNGSSSYMVESVPISKKVVDGSGTDIWRRLAVALSRLVISGGFSTLASDGYGNSVFKLRPSNTLVGLMS